MALSCMPTVFAVEPPSGDSEDYAAWKASQMKSEGAELLDASSVYVRNDYLGVSVADNSRFTIGQVNGGGMYNDTLLLFGHPNPWSSNTLIRISRDGGETYSDYWYEASNAHESDGAIVSSATFDGVTVTQTLRFEKNLNTGKEDVVGIHYDYVNNNDIPVQVGVRIQLDTMLGGNDGAPFRVAGRDVTTEQEYVGSAIPQYWQAFEVLGDDNYPVSTGTFYFNQAQRPDKVQFAYWGGIYTSAWDYHVTEGKSVTGDSAVAAYFNPRTIPSQGRSGVVTYYGLSGITPIPIGNLQASISAPSALEVSENYAGYDNNPFTVTAYLSNIGDATLSNVTAELTTGDGLVLESEPVFNAGDITTDSNDVKTAVWTIRALPQIGNAGDSVEATYTLTFKAGGEVLGEPQTRTITLPCIPDEDAFCNVTFRSGFGEPFVQRVLIGNCAEKPDDPARDDATFAGWYPNPLCVGASWFREDGSSLPVTSDMTLYAKWEGDFIPDYQHVVTYVCEGGDNVVFLVEDGGIIPADAIPEVPVKAPDDDGPGGYAGYWDRDLADIPITQDIMVNAIYIPVEFIPVESVSLSIHALTMDSQTDSCKLDATVTPANATDPSLTWTSSDETVATVDQDGVVTKVGPGEATITVASVSNPDASDTCTVTVLSLESVTIDPVDPILVGESRQLTATVAPEGVQTTFTWGIIRGTEFASIDENGSVTGVAPGIAVVSVTTSEGVSDSMEISIVAPATLEYIRLEGVDDVCVINGDPLSVPDLKVFAVYSDGTEAEVTDYSLSSYTPVPEEDFSKAFDSEDSQGRPCQKQTITVTYTENGVEKTASFYINVVSPRYQVGIIVSRRPIKRVYYQSQPLNLTGLELTVVYNYGGNEVIKITKQDDVAAAGLTVAGYNSNLVGTQEVTISYGTNYAWSMMPNSTTLNIKVLRDPTLPEGAEVIQQSKVLMPQMRIDSYHEGKTVTLTAKVDDGKPIENDTSGRPQAEFKDADEIWYTVDGSIPAKDEGTSILYREPIKLTGTATIKAIAYDGDESSLVASGKVSVPRVERPTANYQSGQLEAGSIIKFDCGTPGAEIRYQLVNSDGDFVEDNFREGNSVMIDNTTDIIVIAYKDGYAVSNTLMLHYDVPAAARGKSATFALGEVTSMSSEKASVSLGVFMDRDTHVKSFHTQISYPCACFNYEALAGLADAATTDFRVSVSRNDAGTIETLDIYYDGDSMLDSGEVASLTFLVNDKAVDGKYDLSFEEQNVSIQTDSVHNSAVTASFNNGMIILVGCENSQLTGEVTLVTADGEDVKSGDQLDGGDNVTASINFDQDSVSVVNDEGNLEQIVSLNVWMAVYGRQGMLLSVQTWDINLSDMDSLMFMQTLHLPDNLTDIGSVKLMVTSAEADMTPLMISTSFG